NGGASAVNGGTPFPSHSACSLPPCGGGLGRGVLLVAHAARRVGAALKSLNDHSLALFGQNRWRRSFRSQHLPRHRTSASRNLRNTRTLVVREIGSAP